MAQNNIRSEILQNSRELFQEQGYSATTVREIAKRTGCTAGSLYYFFEGGKTEILQEVIRSYGLDPAVSMTWMTQEASLDALINRLIVELPLYFQKVSTQLSWLALDRNQLSASDMEMMRKFPLALYASIRAGVGGHIADPKICKQVSWLIYCSFYGYVEVFDKIGLVVDEEFNLEEMGQIVKTAVSAIIAKKEKEDIQVLA